MLSPQVLSQIVGVIDLKERQAVHAVAGKRESYRPVSFCDGDPFALANHYSDLGIKELYVADLDSIGGKEMQADTIGGLCKICGFDRILVDVGWTGDEQSGALDRIAEITMAHSSVHWIAAVESMKSIEAMDLLANRIDSNRLLLGLDFLDGELTSPIRSHTWVESALRLGFVGAVILDLASVGGNSGPITQSLCRTTKSWSPHWALYSGGGIRSDDDIRSLISAGCDRCLVATALHGIL